ncbi:MAG: GNAT family N-acetyltransferase [Labilibaculum sp.]|nr:GNAT family N-acetyltransferase [Labilibaculum sp.]
MAGTDLRFIRLSKDTKIKPFVSGDPDLDSYLFDDAERYQEQLLSVTYILENDKNTVAYFSLSNDRLLIADMKSKTFWKKIASKIGLHFEKRNRKSFPAVKIGRLATHSDYQSKGIGDSIVSWIRQSFTDGNKTGCLFITVDAYNNERAIKFYEKNGFEFMTDNSENDKTRLMFTSLLRKQE